MARRRDERIGSAGRLSSVGIELGVATIAGLLLGAWVDRRVDTAPYGALLGLLLGAAAGFRALLRAVAVDQAEAERREGRRRC